MEPVSYYFSVLSPFTYLAGDRLEGIVHHHNQKINYLPFDILHLFSQTGGVPPKDRHISRQKYRTQELIRIAKRFSMPIHLAPKYWPTDPKPASYAIIHSLEESRGDTGKLVQNFLKACWAEERDISEIKVVQDCLENAGFDQAIATKENAQAEKIFQENTQKAIEANVFGAPTYLWNGEVFWGQDRLCYLDDALKA